MAVEIRSTSAAAGASTQDTLAATRALQRQVTERLLLSALRESDAADDARASQQRAAFLADAGHDLAKSLDQDKTQAVLANFTLPSVADWCMVDLIDADGSMDRLTIVHRDPGAQTLIDRLESHWRPMLGDGFGVPAVLENAKSVQVTDDVDAALEVAAHDDENLRVLRELDIGSLLTTPLITNGEVCGAITFVNSRRMRAFTEQDVELAEALAERGALGLEKAHQYAEVLLLKNKAEREARASATAMRSMSHELRTPLQAIAGFVEIIDMGIHGPVTDAQHNDLQQILSSQRHLTSLVDDLLQFLQARAVALLPVTAIPVSRAIERALHMAEPLMLKKGLRQGVQLNGVTGVCADETRLHQILINLLANAIKFTGAGGEVTIACKPAGAKVEIAISDTGRGIPTDRLESIFEPFVRVADGQPEKSEGLGLGLGISRDLARAMGGDIQVASTLGIGSTFTLTLPGADPVKEPLGL